MKEPNNVYASRERCETLLDAVLWCVAMVGDVKIRSDSLRTEPSLSRSMCWLGMGTAGSVSC